MRRSLALLLGVLAAVGCNDHDTRERTVFVEVTSSPSGLLTRVAVGFSHPVEFDERTPIARNVRADVLCHGDAPTPRDCEIFASAIVKDGDVGGTRVTMCLFDAGKQDCETSNDGRVFVTMRVFDEN